MKLDVMAFAWACALFWGIGVLLGTWWILLFDGSQEGVVWLSHIYRGYKITPLGSFIGLVWGFFDGLIGGAIFAWLYNQLAGRRSAL